MPFSTFSIPKHDSLCTVTLDDGREVELFYMTQSSHWLLPDASKANVGFACWVQLPGDGAEHEIVAISYKEAQ